MAKHSPRFVALVHEALQHVREVSPQSVCERLQRGETFHLIDVREQCEWQAGRVPCAVHMARGILERDIESCIPDTGAEIVLYCGGGYRSALAAESLQRMGYTNVWSMAGGFRGWVEAGLPVVG